MPPSHLLFSHTSRKDVPSFRQVFSLNNCIIALGVLAACAVHRTGPGRSFAGAALSGAALCGLALAHQHAALLTALPLAIGALAWLHRAGRITPSLVAGGLAAFLLSAALPIAFLWSCSQTPTAGSWGDLTSLSGLARHVLRAEYGTFSLGAGTAAAASRDRLARVAAYFRFAREQVGAAGLALAVAGMAASSCRPNVAGGLSLAATVGGAWAVYVVAWHGIWCVARRGDRNAAVVVGCDDDDYNDKAPAPV